MSDPDNVPQQKRRVALIASSGGHWIELIRLFHAVEDDDCLFIATSPGLTAPCGTRPVLRIQDGSRDDPWRLLKTFFSIGKALLAFRPNVLITTGAAPGAVALMVGKMLGATTIWIDSIANSEELSMSGRFAKAVADLRLTQWEHLADPARKISYFGRVV